MLYATCPSAPTPRSARSRPPAAAIALLVAPALRLQVAGGAVGDVAALAPQARAPPGMPLHEGAEASAGRRAGSTSSSRLKPRARVEVDRSPRAWRARQLVVERDRRAAGGQGERRARAAPRPPRRRGRRRRAATAASRGSRARAVLTGPRSGSGARRRPAGSAAPRDGSGHRARASRGTGVAARSAALLAQRRDGTSARSCPAAARRAA